MFYLFYHQLRNEGMFHPFESDTVVHVRMAIEDHYIYSLVLMVFYGLSLFGGEGITIPLFLTLIVLFTIECTRMLIDKLLKREDLSLPASVVYLMAFAGNFVMAFYVKAAHHKHYIGYQNASVWHNSTYICMKLLAILTIFVFVDLYDKDISRENVGKWIGFTVLLSLSTAVKTSFLMAFVPTFSVILLIRLIKGTKFSKVLLMACTMLPSFFIMLWQSYILMGDDQSSFTISPFRVLAERSTNPKLTVVLSVLFPALVFLFNIRHVIKDRMYFGSLLLAFFGFAFVFLFAETGSRVMDGNFIWTYSISLFFLFLISLIRLIKSYLESDKKPVKYISFCGLLAIYSWHVISGIWFFVLLLQGNSYFI